MPFALHDAFYHVPYDHAFFDHLLTLLRQCLHKEKANIVWHPYFLNEKLQIPNYLTTQKYLLENVSDCVFINSKEAIPRCTRKMLL